MERVEKMCIFHQKTGHISETVRDRLRLLLITNIGNRIRSLRYDDNQSTLDDLEGH